MRKMRKLAALALTAVMTMAMSITAFAEPADGTQTTSSNKSATVTITNVEDDATIQYVQLIKEDRTKTTGWTINDTAAFSDTGVTDEQAMVKWYLSDERTDSDRIAVLNKVNFTATNTNVKTVTNKTFTVSEAGLYVINVTPSENSGYTYTRMAANVNFGEDGKLANVTVNAKRTPNKPNKQLANPTADEKVEITKIVDYSVDFTVPYFEDPVKGENETILYGVTDSLTNGKFVVDDQHQFIVKLDGVVDATLVPTFNEAKTAFDLDLSSLINAENSNRNKTVTITYSAEVTGVMVNNTAKFVYHNDPDENSEVQVKSYTGTIQVLKTAEDEETPLEGAEFVIYKKVGNDKLYAQIENNTLKAWVAEANATKVATDEDGLTAKIHGFDADETYYVWEVTAPEGYHVDNLEHSVTLEAVANATDAAKNAGEGWAGIVSVTDTKLASLPFTGGMGTTIFTVLGVAIMALAAALYFASKRSATK